MTCKAEMELPGISSSLTQAARVEATGNRAAQSSSNERLPEGPDQDKACPKVSKSIRATTPD